MASYARQAWVLAMTSIGAVALLLFLIAGAQAQSTDQERPQAPSEELPERPHVTGQEAPAPLPPQAPPQSISEDPSDYANTVVDKDPQGNPYVAGELIVTLKPGLPAQARDAAVQQAGVRTAEELPELDARKLVFTDIKNEQAREARERALEQARQALERRPDVQAADYNYIGEPDFVPNDFRFRDEWGLKKINAPEAWNRAYGNGVRLAVLDSGFASDHEDLRSQIIYQRDFIHNDNKAEVDRRYVWGFDHGTHVAGTVAAATNNRKGIAGTSPGSDLFVAKVCRPFRDADFPSGWREGCPTWAGVKALRYFAYYADHSNIKAVNISIGGFGKSDAYGRAVDYAWRKGLVVVASAGNESTNRRSYPAAFPRAIAVSATNGADDFAGFSNYGSWVDVAAPGVNILSTVPGGYRYSSGTSMAAPHVTGLAGLLGSQGLNNAWIRYQIEAYAADRGANGWDPRYGWGRINAQASVNW